MKKTIKACRSEDMRKRAEMLLLEVDEELDRLFAAMQDKSESRISASKSRLSELHQEMMILGVL